jgi:EpsD family peptidyl-prolyl cis-trans isomerase
MSNVRLSVLLVAIAVAAGCGKSDRQQSTQVAARVNSDEITVHQVNNVLAKTPNIKPELADRAKREILDRLIDQQLARQQAIAGKLDRSPTVLQALEAAKSEILARAYVERIASEQPRPAAAEIKKYYEDHPELFSQRRVFSLEEIVFVSAADVAAGLRERAAKAASMQEIADWLHTQGINAAVNSGLRAAEQISLDLLPRLRSAKDGEILVNESGGNWQVVRVVASKAEPVDEATAAPRIQQYLFNRRSGEAVAREMKQLKTQAKIEYVGEFAAGAGADEAKARAEADSKARTEAKSLADTKARAEEAEVQARSAALTKARTADAAKERLDAERNAAANPSKSVQLPQQNIEKGVGGLK